MLNLILDMCALIWSKSPQKHILDPKCALLEPQMMLELSDNIFILTGWENWPIQPLLITFPPIVWIFLPFYDQKVQRSTFWTQNVLFWAPKWCRSPQKIFSSRLAQKTDQYDHNFGYFRPDMTKKSKKDILDPKCALWTQKWCQSLPKIFSSWRAQKVDLCDLISSTCSPLLWIFLPLYRVIRIKW